MNNFKLFFYLIILILLTNCIENKKPLIDKSHIKINDDVYLKPLGKNENDCSIFSPYSLNGNIVTQVIYFLDQNGDPTMISNPKNCK
tara:strand:- start:376 stop:636 length:261 start_codon:yes stop_codon:yes gene_type:complete